MGNRFAGHDTAGYWVMPNVAMAVAPAVNSFMVDWFTGNGATATLYGGNAATRDMSLGEGAVSNGDWTTTKISIDNEAVDSTSTMDRSMVGGDDTNPAAGNAPSWYGASDESAAVYNAQATTKMVMATAFTGGDSSVDGSGDEVMANAAAFNASARVGSPC